MANASYNTIGAATNSCQLAPKNTKRSELIVTNNSVAALYLSFGAAKASPTNFAAVLPYGGTFVTAITDAVNGAWASAATGGANVTEVS